LTVLDAREAEENSRAGFSTNRKRHASAYDYEDDSDLREDDEEDISDRGTDLQVPPKLQ
jgi:hypothetical protein